MNELDRQEELAESGYRTNHKCESCGEELPDYCLAGWCSVCVRAWYENPENQEEEED